MSRIQMTEAAEEDLAAIRAYIRRDSKVNAIRFVKRLREAIRGIRRFPEAASIVQPFNQPSLREIFVGNYRIIYRLRDGVSYVITVIHGARLLPDSVGRQ